MAQTSHRISAGLVDVLLLATIIIGILGEASDSVKKVIVKELNSDNQLHHRLRDRYEGYPTECRKGEKSKHTHPVNAKHLYNICTMLDQRRRRWADIL